MDNRLNIRATQRSLYPICFLAMLIHVILLVFFTILRIHLMAYVNVLSVTFYAISLLLVKKWRLWACIIGALVEVITHAGLALLSVGPDLGFQFYFINCIAMAFFADYFAIHNELRPIGSFKLGVLCSILYMGFLIGTRSYDPIYHVDENLAFIGLVLNSLLTLGLIVLFFNLLKNTAAQSEKMLRNQATHDNLTGLVNRRFFIDYMDGVYASGKLENSWLAILDIDNFKHVNDHYGHLNGDYVLKTVANILKEICGDLVVCRWGGEEFMVVGVGSETKTDAKALLETIRQRIAAEDFTFDDGTVIKLTVTIGKGDYCPGQTLTEWFAMVDDRLYVGKQSGKNRIVDI